MLIDMPVKTDGRSSLIRSSHPDIGEHSRDVATLSGLSDAEIDRPIESGVLHMTSPGDTE